jgi:hypothetical protein
MACLTLCPSWLPVLSLSSQLEIESAAFVSVPSFPFVISVSLGSPFSTGRQTIFLGANDCCFPTAVRNQCVPLPVFTKNIIKIIQHPAVVAHSPRIMLITPPPIDERSQEVLDLARGFELRRTAENTKKYADAVRNVGLDLGIPVCDAWSRFMEIAGWKPGEPLPGRKDLPPNQMFKDLTTDGESDCSVIYRITLGVKTRAMLYNAVSPSKADFSLSS